MALTLTSLYRYPVKSCRREELSRAEVQPWGLAGDRRWMVVDGAGSAVTAREHPRLQLVRARQNGHGLQVGAADMPDLVVATPDGSTLTEVDVHGNPLDASPATADADAWFTEWLGVPVRLVYLDDPTRRHPNPAFSTATDRVTFADAYPLLLASADSLAALNDAIAQGPRADEGPLPMTRFRPNLVVSGAPPWAEDGWRRLRIGGVTLRAVKGCDRCVMTMVDPETARKTREPIATLARIRRFDGETWFGMNLIPDSGTTLNVGDPVEILDEVASDGPPR